MSLIVRAIMVSGLFLGLESASSAQYSASDDSSSLRLPYFGNRPRPIFSGGAYYGPNGPFRPNRFDAPSPFRELLPNPSGMPQPRGQEGPGGLMLPYPAQTQPEPMTPSVRSANPSRSVELVELGDRAFRGGNYRRAEERYKLAARSDPETPTPHIHLAQIAIFRADYATAAGYFRDAIASTRGSGWLVDAPDIQALYGEPGDFVRQVARLESYLQTHPDDRNAWFVLGVENYLSGHPQPAVDAFLRLTDRRPDEALAAFLDAATRSARRANQADLDATN